MTKTKPELPARLVAPGPGGQGRTSWEVTPTGLALITDLAGKGCSATTIAQALGMHVATLREVRKRDPEVEEAYQQGLAREHDQLICNLRRLADEGNVVANLFLLKARHNYREGDNPELNLNINTGGVLVVPARQSVAEFLAEAGQGGANG